MKPPLPSLACVTRQLRWLAKAWSSPDAGGEFACLYLYDIGNGRLVWCVEVINYSGVLCAGPFGREYVPGGARKFDAVAAARRMLSDARAKYAT